MRKYWTLNKFTEWIDSVTVNAFIDNEVIFQRRSSAKWYNGLTLTQWYAHPALKQQSYFIAALELYLNP